MKKKMIALMGLFISLGVIVVYHQDKTPLEKKVFKVKTPNYNSISALPKEVWICKTVSRPRYSQEDLELLAHAINAEQGIEYADEQKTNMLQIYAGEVILNRLERHHMGANSIRDVLYADDQYACVSDHSWDNPISDRAYQNAEILLSGVDYAELYGIPQMPDNVIYQAEFEQGIDVWKHIEDTAKKRGCFPLFFVFIIIPLHLLIFLPYLLQLNYLSFHLNHHLKNFPFDKCSFQFYGL